MRKRAPYHMGMRIIPLALAAARLTRLVTTDDLGEWLIHEPAFDWAHRHEASRRQALGAVVARLRGQTGGMSKDAERLYEKYKADLQEDDPITWQAKLVSGLECPYCVGFWLGAGLLAADRILPNAGAVRSVFDLGVDALALNYVTARMETLG